MVCTSEPEPEVAADHGAPTVSNGDVQVGAIGLKGAGESEDLQVAGDGRGLSSPRQTQLVMDPIEALGLKLPWFNS